MKKKIEIKTNKKTTTKITNNSNNLGGVQN